MRPPRKPIDASVAPTGSCVYLIGMATIAALVTALVVASAAFFLRS